MGTFRSVFLNRGEATGQTDVTGGVGTTDIDWESSPHWEFTFGAGNETLTFTAPRKGVRLTLIVIQDSVGSRTMTWPTILWPGAVTPTLSTGANDVDIVHFYYDGANYRNYGFTADSS